EPVAAIGFRNADRRQAERGVDRAPPLALIAAVGLHQPADFLHRRAVRQQAAQVGAELFLLARKTELHHTLPAPFSDAGNLITLSAAPTTRSTANLSAVAGAGCRAGARYD